MEQTKKFNKRVFMLIVVLSIASILSYHFNVYVLPVLTISICLSAVAAFIAFMQVFSYRDHYDYNPGNFWFTSNFIAIVLIVLGTILAYNIFGEHLADSMICGLSSTLLPILGAAIGDMTRSIIKSDSLIIWR
jgi:accessory gene regulator protein AgrB